MDTIIYFYKKRDAEEPLVEPVGLKRYMLIRVGLNVGDGEWFGEDLEPEGQSLSGEAVKETEKISGGSLNEAAGEGPAGKRGLWRGFRWLSGLVGKGRRERAAKRQRAEEERAAERLVCQREERFRRTGRSMAALRMRIRELAGEEDAFFCVYEDSVRKRLTGKSSLAGLWQNCIDWREFEAYRERFWVEELMTQAELPYFVILGTAPCMPEVVWKHARRMKALRWILPEADCAGEFLEFVEDFYVDNGLAIGLETLSGAGDFSCLQLACEKPSNIIDFTGETAILTSGVAEGSIWLDMLSAEEKGRRIRGRNRHISYFSMKERWKSAQRRCRSPLES